jgi:DNA-binding response OmpR family regulator
LKWFNHHLPHVGVSEIMGMKYSVLIVEDEPLIVKDVAGSAEKYGFNVSGIACDASSVRVIVSAYRPDAVLLDVNLGARPGGFELAHFITAQHDVPLVFLTSHSDR